jgi:16S rRNA (guanine527-N7)-methyltransferase
LSPHGEALAALGIEGAPRDRLAQYLDHVASWSTRVNLTGARDAADRVRVLIRSVLPAVQLVERSLIDVGSGNGSPGLVLACLRPEVRVTLLEPRLKRWAFLREAARALGRDDIEVQRVRHDEYSGPAARTVTVRALALRCAELVPLVEPGGRLVVLGPPLAPDDRFAAEPGQAAGVFVLRRVG